MEATFALQQAGLSSDPRVQKGIRWLVDHQDRAAGRWLARSLNKERDPETEPSKFMNDVATAYAVLALSLAAGAWVSREEMGHGGTA